MDAHEAALKVGMGVGVETTIDAATGQPVVVIETEIERMKRERREKKHGGMNIAEKTAAYKVEIDPKLEERVAYDAHHTASHGHNLPILSVLALRCSSFVP